MVKTFLGKGGGAEDEVGRGVRIIVLEVPLLKGTCKYDSFYNEPPRRILEHISKQIQNTY